MPRRSSLPPLPPPGGWRSRLADLTDRVGLSSRPWVAALTSVVVVAVVVAGVFVNRSGPRPGGSHGLPKTAAASGNETAVGGSSPQAREQPRRVPTSGVPADATPGSTTSTAPREVVVHVVGAIARAGIYRLPPDSRVADAIAAAGGPGPDADTTLINVARPVADGEQVRVPRKGEVPPPTTAATPAGRGRGSAASAAGSGRVPSPTKPNAPVDLNTAGQSELEALPGIGPTTATAIIRHRETKGRFTSVEQLEQVPGIGPARLAQLRPHVRV